MNIFLDACTVIYLIEAGEPFHSIVKKILSEIAQIYPEAAVAISRLSVLECLVLPTRNQEFEVVERYRTFFSRQDLYIIELAPEVVERALWIRVRYNLRTPDALQAACALEMSDHIFLTGDRAFQRIPDLNIHLI